jgi:hypothetical protein
MATDVNMQPKATIVTPALKINAKIQAVAITSSNKRPTAGQIKQRLK